MDNVTSLSEKELKNKVNDIRTQLNQNERSLRSAFNELKMHRTNVDEIKQKRDDLNSQVRTNVSKAQEFKKKEML